MIRIKGENLLRKDTKSSAGERTLPLPASAAAVLRRRFMTGARLVADHLGHSRTTMPQDYYLGRRVVDSQTAAALEAASRDVWPGDHNRGNTVGKEEGQEP